MTADQYLPCDECGETIDEHVGIGLPCPSPREAVSSNLVADAVEPYLQALTRYIDGVYSMAMQYRVPAKDAAFHAKHMQDAVLGIRRILQSSGETKAPLAYHVSEDKWWVCNGCGEEVLCHATYRCSGCGAETAEGPSEKTEPPQQNSYKRGMTLRECMEAEEGIPEKPVVQRWNGEPGFEGEIGFRKSDAGEWVRYEDVADLIQGAVRETSTP